MTVPLPSLDPFYDAASGGPGQPLRVRPVAIGEAPQAAAWQLVFGSTGARGQSIAGSATVLIPRARWTGPGPRPVLSYGVGVHGLGRDGAPSYLLRVGAEAELPLISLALDRGWAVAIADGEGLGLPGPHTYGAGHPGGHALLDVVRACVHSGLLSAGPVLVWGYSEGGRYAAWAAELQPTYAPELSLVAVAAGGVPADLRVVAQAIDGGPFSGLGLAVLIGLSHAHQDRALDRILNDHGTAAASHAATLDAVGLIVEHPEPLRCHTIRDEPWDDPVWRSLLDRERNGRRRPAAPVYLYHVVGDEVVPTELGRRLFLDYRELGASVTWADVIADDHLNGAFVGAPAALHWLDGRLRDSLSLWSGAH